MYYAAIDTESLTNPTVLNDFKAVRTVIEYEPNSTIKYHNVFLFKLSDSEIAPFITNIARFLKSEWYALYWNNIEARIQFKDVTFDSASEALKYGQKHGIDIRSLDFQRYIQGYNKYVLDT